MLQGQLILHAEDHQRIGDVVLRLVRNANAKAVFVVDSSGHLMAEAGESAGVDSTRLASLAAGCVAATGGLAQVIGEAEFPIHYHQGERDNLHISLIGQQIILVVIFDDRSSLGLVRLRVKKASAELAKVLDDIEKKTEHDVQTGRSPFAEITDADIDNLFAD